MMRKSCAALSAVVLVGSGVALAPTANAASNTTTAVSVSENHKRGNGDSYVQAMSASGRFIAFTSAATNLVAGDSNQRVDVFVRDSRTKKTTRVSVTTGGAQGNKDAGEAAISANGRYVAFDSQASNLVAGDTNKRSDVFVRDRRTNTTTRVSVATGGAQGTAGSFAPAISADGRYIAFQSRAANLVARDTNKLSDIFVRDTMTGTTRRVSVTSKEAQAKSTKKRAVGAVNPSMSADGHRIAFESDATNLGGRGRVYVRDTSKGKTTAVDVRSGGGAANAAGFNPVISADGRHVAFTSEASNILPGETNGAYPDVFIRNLSKKTTQRVSVTTGGAQVKGGYEDTNADVSAISANGRYVVFGCTCSGLVRGDTNRNKDVFVRDTWAKTTKRVSVKSNGKQATGGRSDDGSLGGSEGGAISARGRFIAFDSNANFGTPAHGVYSVYVRGPVA